MDANLFHKLDSRNIYFKRLHVEEMLKNEKAGTHLYASVVLKSSGEMIGIIGAGHTAQKPWQ